MTGQEKERAYLARELHDELGQVLTALRMEAVWIRNRVKDSDAYASARALTMCELIDKTIEEVRGLAIRLRPGVLDHLGLVDAIEWYTADFEKRCHIACVFKPEAGPDIRGNIATAAYRITQEALTNVARHASATRVTITMSFTGDKLTLTIRDDGKGFDPDSLGDSRRLRYGQHAGTRQSGGGTFRYSIQNSGGGPGSALRYP
jgi:signal transduction histidine kinase